MDVFCFRPSPNDKCVRIIIKKGTCSAKMVTRKYAELLTTVPCMDIAAFSFVLQCRDECPCIYEVWWLSAVSIAQWDYFRKQLRYLPKRTPFAAAAKEKKSDLVIYVSSARTGKNAWSTRVERSEIACLHQKTSCVQSHAACDQLEHCDNGFLFGSLLNLHSFKRLLLVSRN